MASTTPTKRQSVSKCGHSTNEVLNPYPEVRYLMDSDTLTKHKCVSKILLIPGNSKMNSEFRMGNLYSRTAVHSLLS